jgi:uroporphyrinogen-III synthase
MAISSNEKTYALIANPANKKRASALNASGANVIQFPPIKTKKLILDEKSTALFSELTDFDWLIFPDIFAVDYFLQTLEEHEIDLFELDAVRVCALGEAVSDRLRFASLHADVIPNSVESAVVLAALYGYVGESDISGKNFLSIEVLLAEKEIKNKLLEKGAIVTELAIYRVEITGAHENARLKALLKGGAIDEFVFSSPADLISLKKFAASESLAEILSETEISAVDEITFQSLKEHNLKPKYFQPK